MNKSNPGCKITSDDNIALTTVNKNNDKNVHRVECTVTSTQNALDEQKEIYSQRV